MASWGRFSRDQRSSMAVGSKDNALDHVVVVVFKNRSLDNVQGRFKLGEEVSAPYNVPEPGQRPTMDGFVADYISVLTAELGCQPTYEECPR
jgi:hypothetical protein